MALSASLHFSENWNMRARDARRRTVAEMKHTRKTAGCTWTDYKTNTETANELISTPVLEKIQEYRRNWLQHTRWFKYDRDGFVCKQAALRSSCATLRE